VASISARFFDLVVERFLIGFFGFGGCTARFLITQSSLFQQPAATRIGVLDVIGFFEKIVDERRRPRQRVDPDFRRRFMNGLFELFLL
jgi:hypothetical protein